MKSPILLLSLLLLFSCGKKSDDLQPPVTGIAPKVEVNFNNNTYAPLTYTTGRTDSPADADPAYKAEATGGQLVFSMPASPLRPKLSGFLDLPQGTGFLPVSTDFIHEFTFPDATQLTALGASPNGLAIAGCYVRGAVAGSTADWTNGDGFGGFWFGFVKTPDGQRLSAIRSGNAQVASEPFAATGKVSYRIVKKGTTLQLFRQYDAATEWTKVGSDLVVSVRAGGSSAVAITHVRVLNNSDEAVRVVADDFKWYY